MSFHLIDLFSGAGGMTLGFTSDALGGVFEPVCSVDNDSAATATHASNFSGRAVTANIETWLREEDVPGADVVIGGPPCQGFSLLNKKRIGDRRRALWEPFLDVVRLSGAKIFVMENVAELYRSTEYRRICQSSNEMGFDVVASVLNTADFGVAQTRRRTIILGWQKSMRVAPTLPTPTHGDPRRGNLESLAPWRTVRDVIADLPAEPIGTEIGASHPLNLHFGRNPTELSKRRYRIVPEGGNRFDLQRLAPELTPQCWIKKTSVNPGAKRGHAPAE